jgi:streptogramin lyase
MAFGSDRHLYVACFTVGYQTILARVSLHGEVTTIPYPAGFPEVIPNLVDGRDGNVYFSSGDGALVSYDPSRQKFHEYAPPQPPNTWIGAVTVGADGRIWAGAEGAGLYAFLPGKL